MLSVRELSGSSSTTKFCQHCGAQIDVAAEICPKCGIRVAPAPQTFIQEKKSTGIAAIASVILPGLGQIYNGQIGKGIMFIILAIIFGVLVILLIGLILYPLFWAYNIYDAYNTAKKINAGIIKSD
jgi:TM2 domain-containing membrane protein YozV/ribosomal protein L40E